MSVSFDTVMLEVTRKCNMNCAHCMRGEMRDFDMQLYALKELFSQTKSIKHLGLTGGEPSLAPYVIKWIGYYANQYDCKIDSFFCATNAKHYSEEFVKELSNLYYLCENKDDCILTVSTDQFHSPADKTAMKNYRKLPFYNPVNEKGEIHKWEILNEGRAKANGLGQFSKPEIPYFYDVQLEGLNLKVSDVVYINALGELLLDSDMSYENQEDFSLGNIIRTPIEKLVVENLFKIPSDWLLDGKGCYRVHVLADERTVTDKETEETFYCETADKASAAYHRFLRNLVCHPIYWRDNIPPEDLEVIVNDLPKTETRCIGANVSYKSKNETKQLLIEICKCPFEESAVYGIK